MQRHHRTPTGTARRQGRARLAVALVSTALLLAGCSGDGDATVTTGATPDATSDRGAAPDPALPTTWPLTGVESAELANRPAIAVKIENSREARPQTGLEAADVVWEEVVEGGVTRYIAVYHSQQPEVVGPIRSVRPMDANIIAPLHGLMVFSGGQPPFVDAVATSGLQIVSNDRGDAGFSRSSDRRAPHNVYGALAEFAGQADPTHLDSPAEQFEFAADPASASTAAGTPAGALAITMSGYSSPSWAWDAASGRYLRSEGTTPAVSVTGDQLGATNVVVLSVPVVDTAFLDPAGTPVPETQVIGSGEALVVSGGQSVPATWSKEGTGTPVVLTGADGQPVQLAPGNTWVELVPSSGGAFSIG